MARVQANLPHDRPLPPYVTGHEDDGAPARDGTHRHIAVVVDLPRRRILYVPPTLIWRGGRGDRHEPHRLVERALAGMETLRAGPAGRLALSPAPVDMRRTIRCSPRRGSGKAPATTMSPVIAGGWPTTRRCAPTRWPNSNVAAGLFRGPSMSSRRGAGRAAG